jgi:Family of unknown function (DUF6084)
VPDLDFVVQDVEVVPFAAAPLLQFQLQVRNANEKESIHTVALRCQIHIEAARRRYAPTEERKLRDLFGEPERWNQTLRTMLWTHASTVITPFTGCTIAALPVTCTYDFNIAATKFFHGLDEGDIPLSFLFSGTVFYAGEDGALLAAPISWEKEARFRLPIETWRAMMDAYYPNVAWLTIRRDIFDRLSEYKISRGIPTWEQVFEQMLPPEGDGT